MKCQSQWRWQEKNNLFKPGRNSIKTLCGACLLNQPFNKTEASLSTLSFIWTFLIGNFLKLISLKNSNVLCFFIIACIWHLNMVTSIDLLLSMDSWKMSVLSSVEAKIHCMHLLTFCKTFDVDFYFL